MSYEEGIRQQLEGLDVNLSCDDKDKIVTAFVEVDTNKNGTVDQDEIGDLLKCCNTPTAAYKIRQLLDKADLNKDDVISPDEFAKIYHTLNEGEMGKTFKQAIRAKEGIVAKGGLSQSSAEGTQHSYSDEECAAFSNYIVRHLKNDPDCASRLQGLGGEELFKKMGDGILLCKLINMSAPETIDERTINKKNLNKFRKQENLNLALMSSVAIGCNIVNIGATDIMDEKPHLILGLLWQIIRIGLFAKIDLQKTPDLAALLRDGEEMEDLENLSPEDLLLRWVNYHLDNSPKYKQAKNGEHIKNFGADIKDSIAYACLLEQIQPINDEVDPPEYELDSPIQAQLEASSDLVRAENMLIEADKINCREFVTAKDVTKGNVKLNMAFVANLFNTYPALKAMSPIEYEAETREVKTFRNWMNSLGVRRVNKFHRDLNDGVVLLQLYDHIKDGSVDWKKVKLVFKRPNTARIEKVENCNYACDLGKKMGYKVIGMDGNDIQSENKTLTLGLTWQIMRSYTLKILEDLNIDGSGSRDSLIINWVNQKLEENNKTTRINAFNDSSISTSNVVIDLIDSIEPGFINYEIVKVCENDADKLSNAKYAISMARKLGAKIYALPEDLVEVKAKMVMTVFACLMGRGLDKV